MMYYSMTYYSMRYYSIATPYWLKTDQSKTADRWRGWKKVKLKIVKKQSVRIQLHTSAVAF